MTDPADKAEAKAQRAAAHESHQFWLDVTGKLALPLVTAIVALAGTYLTTKINEQNNVRETINQREQAESALRTQMFRELVSPVVGDLSATAAPDDNRSERLALLAEMLALNFHEHFELGPLMLYVDELPEQTQLTRNRLRAVARRVISRQLAVLGPATAEAKDSACSAEPSDVDIWLTADAAEPVDKLQQCEIAAQPDGKSAYFQCSSAEHESEVLAPFTVSSKDCKDRLTILLADLNWATNTVRVVATSTTAPQAAGGPGTGDNTIPEFVEFSLSPYAMPFSDNTLLRSGNRFGVYLRQTEPSREPCTPPGCDPTTRLMRLSLVWFPRDFIPPRERPTDFEEIRKSLKL
ncbi:MAG TPA: hypothetical protein VFO94_17445 [Gammaproteobacteria bacterium]|jgi:hypothetical protein|nr:hypothetical protein [Gammaproteobacteria bacterium]